MGKGFASVNHPAHILFPVVTRATIQVQEIRSTETKSQQKRLPYPFEDQHFIDI